MPLQPGALLGPYRIDALLGVGGMGEVYRARDTRLGRDAALKVISPGLLGDASLRRRFEIEARAASALNHPVIVTVYDVGDAGGTAWIAMEWIEGQTLRDLMARGPLPLGRVLSISRQIADGLAAAHAKGIIHRDLKPENIMLREDGGAKILDFGVARQTVEHAGSQADTAAMLDAAATKAGAIFGTTGYMSPEQASGLPVDFHSDQFAFGLILYEMLAGRRAFERPSTVETLAAIIRDHPAPLGSLRADIPESLLHLVDLCLAKRPEDRFPSTREIASTLAAIAAKLSATTAEVAPVVRDIRPSAKIRPRAVGIALMTAGMIALAIGAWVRLRTGGANINTLAVLPFENATHDPNADYLSDGLTDSLVDQLSRVPSLKTMARATVMRFRHARDPRGVGRELGVGAILTGTVSKRERQMIVSAELVDVATGARIWGQTYDRSAGDLIRIQESIALQIVDSLRLQLSPADRRNLAVLPTKNNDAYELFLQARFLLQRDNEEDDLEARRLSLQAAEKDPNFADAYLAVASTYARSAGNGYAPPKEAWSRVDEYARKALDLDPGNVGARVALAVRHFQYDWDWPLAEREFGDLSTDPRLFLHVSYQAAAMFYWATRRPERSVAVMEQGLSADPQNMESRVMLADFLAEAGRSDDAVKEYNAIIAAEPEDARPRFGLAKVLRQRNDATGAIDALRNAYQRAGEQAGVEALSNARTLADYDKAQAAMTRANLHRLLELAKERYISPLDIARMHAQAGETELAFAMLDKALTERSPGLVFLAVDRAWDPVRGDARFASVVHRVGIP